MQMTMMMTMTMLRSLRFLKIVAAGFIFLATGSCGTGGSDSGDVETVPLGPNQPLPIPTSIDCPSGTNLTFQNFGGQFLRRYCSGCHSVNLSGSDRHGAPEDINLDTAADGLTFRIDMIRYASGDEASMPPGVAVQKDERTLFREWLKCGAPSS